MPRRRLAQSPDGSWRAARPWPHGWDSTAWYRSVTSECNHRLREAAGQHLGPVKDSSRRLQSLPRSCRRLRYAASLSLHFRLQFAACCRHHGTPVAAIGNFPESNSSSLDNDGYSPNQPFLATRITSGVVVAPAQTECRRKVPGSFFFQVRRDGGEMSAGAVITARRLAGVGTSPGRQPMQTMLAGMPARTQLSPRGWRTYAYSLAYVTGNDIER